MAFATNDDDSASEGYQSDGPRQTPPKPAKRTTSVKQAAPMAHVDADTESEHEMSDKDAPPNKTSKQKRSTASRARRRELGPRLTQRKIPQCYEQCSAADKALYDMKNDGISWAKIEKKFVELGGVASACASTLPNRYKHMRVKFTRMRNEDTVLLLRAKSEVEKGQEEQKWTLIATRVEEMGGVRYPGDVLRTNYMSGLSRGDAEMLGGG